MSWLFTTSRSSPQPDHENDTSFLPQTLTRQLRGVATFVAPPPPSSSDPPPSPALLGVRNDLAEFGGSLKTTGLSLLSAGGISKLASNLLPARKRASEDDAGGHGPGIDDEILGFVAEILKLPDCWTGFQVPLDHHDFRMSDAQREHALAVEELVLEFADARVRVCGLMCEEQFWMIYFLLLLPRLNADDFELPSTPKIVEARDALLQKLQKNTQVEQTQGEGIQSSENNNLAEIVSTAERLKIDDEDDISFSDVEDYQSDISSRSSGRRPAHAIRGSSPSGSNDWVRLNKSSAVGSGHRRTSTSKEKDSESEESNDWLNVDKFDQ